MASDNPQTTRRQNLRQLAFDLWAEIDMEINPPGTLSHTQAVALIEQWLIDHREEIANG